MADFKIGDVVWLKSGGPKMTVSMVISDDPKHYVYKAGNGYENGDVACEWFDGNEKKTAWFKKATVAMD